MPASAEKGTVPFLSRLSSASLALILLAGCEDVSREFLPLEVGNSWTYRVVSSSNGGRAHGKDTIRVLERLEYSWEEDDELAPREKTERFRVREPSGVFVWVKTGRDVLRLLGGTVTTIILHPPFVGSGWTDRAGGRGGRAVFCRVVRREAVETPAGWFFDCVVIERHAEDFSSLVRQWFAPDVGLVKWIVERPGKPAFEWLLEEYETKEGAAGEE